MVKDPVYPLYWVAWTTPDGPIHFRNDVYDQDEAFSLAPVSPWSPIRE
jgi:murein L,D-transpeptidase YcbB/YkuD